MPHLCSSLGNHLPALPRGWQHWVLPRCLRLWQGHEHHPPAPGTAVNAVPTHGFPNAARAQSKALPEAGHFVAAGLHPVITPLALLPFEVSQ